MTAIRMLAFGELDTPSLGVAWIPDGGAAAVIAFTVGSDRRVVTGRLEDGAGPDPWRITGDEISLLLNPSGSPVRASASDAGSRSIDQLCEVTGSVVLEGNESPIACMGSHTIFEGGFELAAIDSFRQTAAWFQPAEGLSLLAYRQGKSRGQDTDLVAAAVLEQEQAPPVADPRLSTTYDAAGRPRRVGLELWFEEGDASEDSGEDEQRHFPRRAAAESVGEPIEWALADFQLHAALLRWHSRGNDGAGMYLLGQRA